MLKNPIRSRAVDNALEDVAMWERATDIEVAIGTYRPSSAFRSTACAAVKLRSALQARFPCPVQIGMYPIIIGRTLVRPLVLHG